MKKLRCVVFGASGFIGGYLVEELVKNNFPVLAVGRNQEFLENKFSHLRNKVKCVQSDFFNVEKNVELINKNDIVFDLVTSSVPATSVKEPILEIKKNIISHADFFRRVCEKEVSKIIFTSSGGSIYGNMGDKPFSETDIPNPQSPHAISKLTTEYFLRYFCQRKQISFTIFRISNPIGKGQGKKDGFGVIPTFLEKIRTNNPPILFNHGKLIRDFIHVTDVAAAMVLSLGKINKYDLYNIGSGQGLTIKEVWDTLKTASNSNLVAIYEDSRDFDVKEIVLDISRFSQEFSWKPKLNVKRCLKKLAKNSI